MSGFDGTYTGAAYSNQFGSWTVTVMITDGQITDVTASTTGPCSPGDQHPSRPAAAARC